MSEAQVQATRNQDRSKHPWKDRNNPDVLFDNNSVVPIERDFEQGKFQMDEKNWAEQILEGLE